MARYDVFLANALADRETAELIVRRLRALKFKVRYDKKREHTTLTPKDYRDADQSGAVLVLWSKESCNTDSRDSDWVHAIAHHARSKDGVLIQATLDASVPDEPFGDDDRYALTGLGPRKLVSGYFALVDDLGARGERTGLRDWLKLKASDKDGKEAWKQAHPSDPLAQAPKRKTTTTGKTQSAAAPAAPVQETVSPSFAANLEQAPATPPFDISDRVGTIMLAAVGAIIVGMLMLSASLRSSVIEPVPLDADGNPLVAQCPAGQMPAYLLNEGAPRPLEPGPIIDDTDE